ncbi:hypothetical protein [Vannielia sp. SX4]|uniref:hypothetical protein n=1 Tax=Vannielia sp. SX4 TaxID=3463852 RepID=UPI004058503E
MIRAALLSLSLLTALPAQAEAPDPLELLSRFDAIFEADGGLGLEFEFTTAVDAARAEGELDADWARVMTVAAVQLMAGLARYERGFALLDEAETLAPESSELHSFILAWRAYFEFWWGHADRARATLARLDHPLDTLLEAEELAFIDEHRADPPDVAASLGFQRTTQLSAEAGNMMIAGDVDQAEQLMRGLRLPNWIAEQVPLVAVNNAVISVHFFSAAMFRGDPETAREHLGLALAELIDETGEQPRIRQAILDDSQSWEAAETLLFTIAGHLDRPQDAANRAMVLDVLRPGPDASPIRRASWALQLANKAIEAQDWDEAARQAEIAVASGALDADDTLSWRVQAGVFRARARYAAGEPVGGAALVDLYVAITEAPDFLPLLKVARTAQIVMALHRAGEHHATEIIGRDLFRYLAEVQTATLQSGETMAAMASYFRLAADHTIASGFVMAHYPPEGARAPQSYCQTFMEIEMCTAYIP